LFETVQFDLPVENKLHDDVSHTVVDIDKFNTLFVSSAGLFLFYSHDLSQNLFQRNPFVERKR
jgi:hypothetical protein